MKVQKVTYSKKLTFVTCSIGDSEYKTVDRDWSVEDLLPKTVQTKLTQGIGFLLAKKAPTELHRLEVSLLYLVLITSVQT